MPARRSETSGHLDLLLLAVIASGPQHGYAIIQHLRDQSAGVFDMKEGTVYPALHRLESIGLVASRQVNVGGRKRRLYELTTAGVDALVQRRSAWDEYSSGVSAILRLLP